MTTLALRLAGPMQSWGDSSRFLQRGTADSPTKSGVLGLLGAALGLRRTDPLEALLDLNFGVRIDCPGTVMRDFQTARSLDGKEAMPLTDRYYLADAVFLAVIEGRRDFIESVASALHRPAFPLYLGRRSCPPVMPLVLDVSDASLYSVLTEHRWIAPARLKKERGDKALRLQVVTDASALPEEQRASSTVHTTRDVPVSFDPELRQYEWRQVARFWVELGGGTDAGPFSDTHDPIALMEGVGRVPDTI